MPALELGASGGPAPIGGWEVKLETADAVRSKQRKIIAACALFAIVVITTAVVIPIVVLRQKKPAPAWQSQESKFASTAAHPALLKATVDPNTGQLRCAALRTPFFLPP